MEESGVCSLALLGEDTATGDVAVEIRNALSGEPVNNVLFDKAYAPRALAVVPDINGNGTPELAVLGVHTTSGKVGVQVRDGESGALLKTVLFSDGCRPVALEVLPDMNGNGRSELAVLGVNDTTGEVTVEIRDAGGGALIRNVLFYPTYQPQALALLPDIDGSGNCGLAVLGVDASTRAKSWSR